MSTNKVADTVKYLISVHPDGRVRKQGISNPPKLEVLNKIVGGYIELIPYFTIYDKTPCIAYCNEYGKDQKLPYNKTANELWARAVGRPIVEDFLVGTIAIIVGPRSFLEKL
jgi:hypothetical protein